MMYVQRERQRERYTHSAEDPSGAYLVACSHELLCSCINAHIYIYIYSEIIHIHVSTACYQLCIHVHHRLQQFMCMCILWWLSRPGAAQGPFQLSLLVLVVSLVPSCYYYTLYIILLSVLVYVCMYVYIYIYMYTLIVIVIVIVILV